MREIVVVKEMKISLEDVIRLQGVELLRRGRERMKYTVSSCIAVTGFVLASVVFLFAQRED